MSEASGKTAKPRRRSASRRPREADGLQQRYATMEDVARAVGVHPTTVSMALRSHPSIPERTREKIILEARRIGYVRDPLLDAFNFHRLRKLAAKEAPSVAFVVDANASSYFFGGPYHPSVYEGIRAAADTHHMRVEVFPLGGKDMTARRLNTILSSRGVQGVLLSTFTLSTRSIELDWNNFAAVKIESHHLLPQFDVVSNDQTQVVRHCMRRLRELGYRRIGLATGREDENRLIDNFGSGVLVEQRALPPEECVPPLLFERTDLPRIAEQVADWVKAHRVDCIMSNWPELILGTPWDGQGTRLATTSLRIPQEVAFASLDVPANCAHIGGIVQNHRLVGLRAMERLSVLVRTHHKGAPANPSATYVPGFFREGPTIPRRSI